ncbi:hypothetical protein LNQ81_16935 [Myroides sp. M-43]|uniref:hypothetical protein n=1 Tax=Myroides oncorhynchi TaxID=2893756 RepID=UPI001E370F63|nr:hypothetical protein [Myroides oncorhynchi]MCC9044360.1 hypothetical protein [Myroides oncorhynchi]
MFRSNLLLIITILLSLSANAQHVDEPLSLNNIEIQKQQWVLQNKEKNLTLQWTTSALEISLVNKAINLNQQKTIYARIPINKVHEEADEYVVLTGKVEFVPTLIKIEWSEDDLEFFRLLEDSAITLNGKEDILEITKGIETKYKFYSLPFDRMCKFVTRFDWNLIALNRDSDKLPKMITSFDFENNVMKGTIDTVPFEVKFDVYYNQEIFSFQSFELVHAKKNKASRKVKEKFGKYFTSKIYRYDIAEQTLNFYKDDKLVLMFGFVLK